MHADVPAAAIAPERGLWGWSPEGVKRGALLVLFALLALRAVSEIDMMREYGPDPQKGIWNLVMIVKLALWFIGGGLAVSLLIRAWTGRFALVGVAALAAWAVAIGYAAWQYDEGRQALAEARDPQTPPARLRQLLAFDGIQVGYELDNRLAANPHTPGEVLRVLSTRVDQAGTLEVLAKNWRTPPDVLEKIRQAKP
jgi:hypothetical protein